MLLNYEELSSIRRTVEVEIPAGVISAEIKRVTNEFAHQAKLPGFRPGKIPISVVRSKFTKEINEEVVERLLPRTFHEAIAEKGEQPVGSPQLQHVDPLVEGAPIRFKAEFEVKPQFELREYRGLEVASPAIEVMDSDIDAMVERLRDNSSVYRPETERGAVDGDFVLIDIVTSAEGIEPKSEAGHVRLGEETPLPEMHEGLRGKKPGEVSSFDKVYPEDAAREEFRGRMIHHDVTVKEIRVQEKPEITDEFAQSAGGFDSIAAMRERIGQDIRRHREQEVLRAKRSQVSETLVASHEFEVPETLVEDDVVRSLQNYARYLTSQGVDVEKAEIDWMKMREEFRPESVKRAKRALILEAVARRERLAASDVEVDAEIRRAAQEGNREFAATKHRLKHEGGYEALRDSLSQEKALDLVLNEAKGSLT